jgi:hypothetical protein
MKRLLKYISQLFGILSLESKPKRVRKHYDNTYLTASTVEYIKDTYMTILDHEGYTVEGIKVTTKKEYAHYINNNLGMNKSYSVITRILAGKYDKRLRGVNCETC